MFFFELNSDGRKQTFKKIYIHIYQQNSIIQNSMDLKYFKLEYEYTNYIWTFKNFRRIIYNVQMTLTAIEEALINLM